MSYNNNIYNDIRWGDIKKVKSTLTSRVPNEEIVNSLFLIFFNQVQQTNKKLYSLPLERALKTNVSKENLINQLEKTLEVAPIFELEEPPNTSTKDNESKLDDDNPVFITRQAVFLRDDLYLSLNFCYEPESVANTSFHIEIFTTNKVLFDSVARTIYENSQTMKESSCYLLLKHQGGYELRTIEEAYTPLVKDNYSKCVQNSIDDIIEDYQKEVPNGRLVLLEGPPGTGKTYLARGLIKEVDSSFIFIPSYSLTEVLSGNFLSFITGCHIKSPVTFFIEDGDEAIRSRQDGGNHALVSTILNITSGLISECFDFRVVVTTNEQIDRIDPALVRHGRLSHRVHIGELSETEAQNVYRRLSKDPKAQYKGSKILSDVYAAANNVTEISNQKEQNKKKIGF